MTTISRTNQACSWSILIFSRPTSAQEKVLILVTITFLDEVLVAVPHAAQEEAKFHEKVLLEEAPPSLSSKKLEILSKILDLIQLRWLSVKLKHSKTITEETFF